MKEFDKFSSQVGFEPKNLGAHPGQIGAVPAARS